MIPDDLMAALLEFRRARDWEQFHTARNLAAALVVEAAELLALFRWADEVETRRIVARQREAIADELADVTILLSYLAHDLDIPLDEAVRRKLARNAARYPADKARGHARKYTELDSPDAADA